MKDKAVAVILCFLLSAPGSTAAFSASTVQTAKELVQLSYLQLLELREVPRFSQSEIQRVEGQLKTEKSAEDRRLKSEEERIGRQLKDLRKQLDELNKRASRDDSETAERRNALHCEILDLESQLNEVKTEREKGLPIIFQNRFAKLELIQKWPPLRAAIEEKIESGLARQRHYGDVEDIGVRDLGIENLARKQHDDIEMGQEAIQEMRTQRIMPPEVEDKELVEYVNRLSEEIAKHSDLKVPIRVTLLDSMEINAFALPGGFLFVNTGLINKTDTESELAGVIAHETAHAAARHGARLMKRATIANIIFQAAQIGAIILTGGAVGIGAYYALQYGFFGLGMFLDLSLLGVSRDYEAEADQLGAQYAWQAGYDPTGFITFFDKMANQEGYVRGASFFRTHPPYIERILSTFSEITYLPPRQELRLDSRAFVEAKDRVAALIRKREQEERDRPTLYETPDCRRKPISELN